MVAADAGTAEKIGIEHTAEDTPAAAANRRPQPRRRTQSTEASATAFQRGVPSRILKYNPHRRRDNLHLLLVVVIVVFLTSVHNLHNAGLSSYEQ